MMSGGQAGTSFVATENIRLPAFHPFEDIHSISFAPRRSGHVIQGLPERRMRKQCGLRGESY